jgi:hypothetical protein
MESLKYVVIPGHMQSESMVIFPAWETHAEIGLKLCEKPISAGCISIYPGYIKDGEATEPQIVAVMGSTTLGIKYNEQRQVVDQRLAYYLLKPKC